MAQPGPKTSWDDLANLCWTKQQVYDTLNPLRDYTMHGLDDMFLNEGPASDYPSYNATKDDPYLVGGPGNKQNPSEPIPVWKYDNSKGSEPYTTKWTDTWSTTSTASLTLTRGPCINLEWSVTIESVAGSRFTITMTNHTSGIIVVESTEDCCKTFEITVPAGETLEIQRTELITKGKFIYAQKYGLDGPTAVIVTTGDEYEGKTDVNNPLNPCLNFPSSDMEFVGLSQSSSFSHKCVSNGDSQKASNNVVEVVKPEDGTKTAL